MPIRLADLTTLGLGGPAPSLTDAHTAAEVAELVGAADQAGGVLVLGGGSNLVVADAGVGVPAVRIAIPGIRIDAGEDAALVRIGAGEDWDTAVAELTDAGFADLAPLSGIPGRAGATPIQNVGAYGSEIAEVLQSVDLYDRVARSLRRVPAHELQLGYRTSRLRGTDKAVVTAITVRLRRGRTAVRYAELARALGVAPGEPAPAARVRAAVLDLRRAKGMVLDPADPDTRSAGSFFTNPVLDAEAAAKADAAIAAALGADVAIPRYPAGENVKYSAAWLIDRSGFRRGYPGPGGRVALSGKHTLALTNRGGATTADLLALAREIRDGVNARFGIMLQPEPVLVGVTLDG